MSCLNWTRPEPLDWKRRANLFRRAARPDPPSGAEDIHFPVRHERQVLDVVNTLDSTVEPNVVTAPNGEDGKDGTKSARRSIFSHHGGRKLTKEAIQAVISHTNAVMGYSTSSSTSS